VKWCLYVAVITVLTATAQAVETGTLTLACKGTTLDEDDERAKPQPFSGGLILNFTAGTIEGFGSPSPREMELPVKIDGIDEVTVTFSGSGHFGDTDVYLAGYIDRVTGELAATERTKINTAEKGVGINYSLKCRPAQRMF
jgi:hypothetical protein